MQPLTQSLLNAAYKPSRLIQRDFSELEMLQSSTRAPYEFAYKSFLRTKDILEQELEKHSCPILSVKDHLGDNLDKAIIVEPIDSLSNFSKSLPFFATVIFYIKKIENVWEATNLVINLPALAEIYYVEKSNGAWTEKYNPNSVQRSVRVRASACKSLERAVIATNDSRNLIKIEQIRDFGSIYYMLMLFATGKVDGIYFANTSTLMQLCLELLIREVGGIHNNFDRKFIGTNSLLTEELKQSII